MLRFRRMKALQKFASVHASFHNHFSLERHLIDRKTYKERRSAAQTEWQLPHGIAPPHRLLPAWWAPCGFTDPVTAEIRMAEIFVAVLGASNYTFAEVTWSQALPDWIGSHVRLFAHLNGVPRLLVPDNLKSGVNKASFYDRRSTAATPKCYAPCRATFFSSLTTGDLKPSVPTAAGTCSKSSRTAMTADPSSSRAKSLWTAGMK